jgi:hypothetical protein
MRNFTPALPARQQIGAATGNLDNRLGSWTDVHRAWRRRSRALFATAAMLAAFACAMPLMANAADPTSAQYCDGVGGGTTGCQHLKGATAGGSASDPSSGTAAAQASGGSASGQLPFTGSDLFSLLAVAVVLTTAGIVLIRTSGRRGRGES